MKKVTLAISALVVLLVMFYGCNKELVNKPAEKSTSLSSFVHSGFKLGYTVISYEYLGADEWIGTAMDCNPLGVCDSIFFISIKEPIIGQNATFVGYRDDALTINWFLIDINDNAPMKLHYGGDTLGWRYAM